MSLEEYQVTVVNDLASALSSLMDIISAIAVLALIVGAILVYIVIHNMMNRR